MAEHSVLDLVPFARAWREVTHMNRHLQPIGESLERHLPEAATAAVAATTVSRDQQFAGAAMSSRPHFLPPAVDSLGCEPGRVVVDPDAYPALVRCEVVDTVRDRLAQFFVHEVVDTYLDWFPFALPLPPAAPRLPLASPRPGSQPPSTPRSARSITSRTVS